MQRRVGTADIVGEAGALWRCGEARFASVAADLDPRHDAADLESAVGAHPLNGRHGKADARCQPLQDCQLNSQSSRAGVVVGNER